MFESILSALGMTKASFISGGIGAAAAALRGDNRPAWQRVVNFTVGFFFAALGAGFVVNSFSLPDTANTNGALGFVLGYLGMTIMDASMAAAAALKAVNWSDIADSWLRKK
jgi:membrane associated rhomboid family serine protease